MPDTVDVKKRKAGESPFRELQPGDPYTFIHDEPVRCEDGELTSVGDFIQRVHSTAEPGYIFKVTNIAHGSVYETVFVGVFGDNATWDRADRVHRAAMEDLIRKNLEISL